MPTMKVLRAPTAFAVFPTARGSKQRASVLLLQGTFVSSHRMPCPSMFTSSSNALLVNPDGECLTEKRRMFIKRSRWTSTLSPVLLQASGDPLSTVGGDGELKSEVGLRDLVVRAGEALSMAYPLWISMACLLALWRPAYFLSVGRTSQMVGLTITMLGMAMTLTLDDFRAALFMPRELAAGFVLQYTVMPFSGYFVSKLLKLPSYYAAGLILLACCPGGIASNIITYLARGNVALSVLMTAASTFASVVLTPFLTSKLAGQFVAVDPAGLFISTVQVVVVPVVIGAFLNQYCNSLVKFVSPVMPLVSVATVAVLCGNAIAQSASAILASGMQVVLAVFSLHAAAFFFGYVLSKLLGIDESSARTVSIQVGVQNSVLGLVLAGKHFGNPLSMVPCAVSSICQSVCGSLLAGIWRSLPVQTKMQN